MAEATGLDVEFAEKPDPLLQTDCAICHLVLHRPCETTCCGVYFCKSCIENQLRYSQSCPHCRKTLCWQVSKAQARLINQLKVYCKLKTSGCKWVGELGQLSKHLNKSSIGSADKHCKYVLLECDRCHEEVKRADFNRHRTKKCPFKDVVCPNQRKGCDWKGQKDALAQHLNSNHHVADRLEGCRYVGLMCSYDCGSTKMRSELEQHEAECQLELVECEFKALGCKAKLSRKDMPAHSSQSRYHVEQLCKTCNSLKRINKERESEIQRLRLSTEKQFEENKLKIEKMEKQATARELEMEKIRLLLKNQTEERKDSIGGALFILLVGFFLVYCYNSTQTKSPNDENLLSTHLLTLPANLTMKNISFYKQSELSWISPPLSLPSKSFMFSLDAYLSSNRLYMQFRTSGSHHSLKANIAVQLMGRAFRQRIFQVEFSEWRSHNEVVSGYQLFMDTDISNFVKKNWLQFRVLQVEIGEKKYPPNIFAVCDLQEDSETLMPSTLYDSYRVSLVVKPYLKKPHVYISVNRVDAVKYYGGELVTINFSFYLLSGDVFDHSVAVNGERNQYSFPILPHQKFLQDLVDDNSCLAFETSFIKTPSLVDMIMTVLGQIIAIFAAVISCCCWCACLRVCLEVSGVLKVRGWEGRAGPFQINLAGE